MQKILSYGMCSLYLLFCTCFWLYWLIQIFSAASHGTTRLGITIEGVVLINGTTCIARIDDDFVCATLDWWPPEKCDYGTCGWGRTSLLNLDLNNVILMNAIKAFSPLKIRLGGTLQDKVIYDTEGNPPQCSSFVKNNSELLGFSQGCLPMSRWDELNIFFKKAGAVVVFGLNELSGKTVDSQGSAIGAWNSSDAESLIRYTVNKGYTIHGWELGNELSGNGVGTRVPAHQYASDINSLQNMVQNIYAGFELKPLVIAPGGFFDANWFTEFIKETPESLQVVSHHIYSLGPGVDDHLIDRILDPSSLDSVSQTFGSLRSILKSSGTRAVAWVGEAGGAYNSGHHLVTDAFVFSFWYLDQLGMASSFDTKTYCRQSLVGGNYGLLDASTLVPNPDYYSALLWHRLMGRNVLSTNFSGTNNIRAYAHCSKKKQGITLLLINLDSNATVQVHVSTENATSLSTSTTQENQTPRTRLATMSRGSKISNITREEYHLTAKDGDLHSQTMLLNGKILAVNSSGDIPFLEPITVNQSEPITVAPFSIVFAQIPYIIFSVCN
ncbi:heparanase-like protein 3 isoform X1 [Juglans microcarpa x Juglans regia]|uniref:heparanase-like protein 3 isoform X1 n=1 Tax=Juglans microcarpa x Juglans regia TaxID=2249226 RepID=UPI001B7DA9CA|nr:heparanase-like protein 3 isoform X1 [Juglans microcarpa x Juglans regia]